MPTHKGIKLSVVSQWELQMHPEFPHPDSSQFTFRSPDLRKSGTHIDYTPPSASSDSKADRLLGRQSAISVYIPSLSGARFWIRYSIIETVAALSQWYYFKLFINGRHIASWGTNATTKPSGQVMRGLFEPSARWNYKDNGIVYKNNGTEARPFFFNKEVDGCSAADDGGLIEVLVFRAKGRRRRVPRPEEFRSQDKYGIVMPSGGLIDKPQDAKFYEWHLLDPKDNPYATFKFHYRSWDSLVSLHLIPVDHPRTLLPSSPSLLCLNGLSIDAELKLEEAGSSEFKIKVDEIADEGETRDSMSSENSATPWMTTVFDDFPDHAAVKPHKSTALFATCGINSLHLTPLTAEVPISRFSETPSNIVESLRHPQHYHWAEILDRPLPEIPVRGASLSRANHSRNSSTVSRAPSITPSLRSYLERDTISPEPVIGVASVVPVLRSAFVDEPEQEDNDSVSNAGPSLDTSSQVSPASTTASRGRRVTSPLLGGVFNLSNITLRTQVCSPSKHISQLTVSPVSAGKTSHITRDRDEEDPDNVDSMTSLSLTESEWMCPTPSPTRNDTDEARLGRIWSPGVEGQRRSRDRSVLGNNTNQLYADVKKGEGREEGSVIVEKLEAMFRNSSGNWI